MHHDPSGAGFTLIELLVVIAIIAVLAGVAAPYYQDYIADSRRAVLKQNMANLRKVVNEFQGDNRRGPFRVQVRNGGADLHLIPPSNDLNTGSELVAGPIQIINGAVVRRKNLRYIPTLPILEDPETGARLNWSYGTSSAFFIDENVNGVFDFDSDFAFIDEDRNQGFCSASDTVLYMLDPGDWITKFNPAGAVHSATIPLDYIDVVATDSLGYRY